MMARTVEIIVEAERDLYTDSEWRELLMGTETITRCRDCTHYDEGSGWCYTFGASMGHLDHCSRAIRKENDPWAYPY